MPPQPIPRSQQLTVKVPEIPEWTAAVPDVPVLTFPAAMMPRVPKYATPMFSTTGTLSVQVLVKATAAPAFNAVGTLTRAFTVKANAAPSFTGSGKLTAIADENGRLTVEFDAEGTLTVASGPLLKPAFTASGALSAESFPRFVRTAAFTASGSLSAATTAKAKATPAFTASGSLSAPTERRFSDQFNRADGYLGSAWTTSGSSPWLPYISGNAVTNYGDGSDGTRIGKARYNATAATDNQYVRMVLGTVNTNFTGCVTGIVLGSDAAMLNYVSVEFNQNTMAIANTVNGTATALASTAFVGNIGDVFELQRVGLVYNFYRNGVLTLTYTESGGVGKGSTRRHLGFYVTSYRGFFQNRYSTKLDSWGGGDM